MTVQAGREWLEEIVMRMEQIAAERCCGLPGIGSQIGTWALFFRSLRKREIGRHFCGMSHLLFFLRVSWGRLAGCGAGEEEVAFAGVAGKGGGAFELDAGFRVTA
jgi:hypothetical protein